MTFMTYKFSWFSDMPSKYGKYCLLNYKAKNQELWHLISVICKRGKNFLKVEYYILKNRFQLLYMTWKSTELFVTVESGFSKVVIWSMPLLSCFHFKHLWQIIKQALFTRQVLDFCHWMAFSTLHVCHSKPGFLYLSQLYEHCGFTRTGFQKALKVQIKAQIMLYFTVLFAFLLKNSSNLFPCPEGSYLPIDMILVPFVYVKILSNKHESKINPFELTKKIEFSWFKILAENINMIGKIRQNDRL